MIKTNCQINVSNQQRGKIKEENHKSENIFTQQKTKKNLAQHAVRKLSLPYSHFYISPIYVF